MERIVTGQTIDSDFPVTSGALQSTFSGTSDAFLAKVVIAGDLRATVKPSAITVANNSVATFNAQLTNFGPDGSDNVVYSQAIPPGMSFAGVNVPRASKAARHFM